ncbi:MAG: hypothetical protein P8N02_15210 [Actinomycetota bacterium]|jgi:hypothetical protein|nr:hypothetical protein [Actinomycetota bacterium]
MFDARKRLISGVLATLLLLGAVGCSDDDPVPSDDTPAQVGS